MSGITAFYDEGIKPKGNVSESYSLSRERADIESKAKANDIRYSLNRDNASEVAEEVKGLSALEDLQKRYAYYRKKISSQREKRLTTFDTKRIFYLKFRISSSAF